MNRRYDEARLGWLVVLVVAVAVWVWPVGARAQREADSAREALMRTDEVIARAKVVVGEGRSQKGRLSLEIAEGIQVKAWEGFRWRRYAIAAKLTIEAREEAWHAIALARGDAQGEETLARITDDTADRIARLRDLIAEGGIRDEQSMKLVDEARALLDKSRINAQQHRYQLALKLAGNARQLTLRAEERVRNIRTMSEMTERRLAILERLVERAREQVRQSRDERARADLAVAERRLDKARELIRAGRYREARHPLDTCERMLRSSVRLVPPLAATDPAARLEGARQLLERAEEMIGEQGVEADPKSLEMLSQARTMLGRAEEALASGRPAEAQDLIAQARQMLRAGLQTESNEVTRERIARRITRIEALREEAGNLASVCPAPGIKELMDRAGEHLRLAKEHADASRLAAAEAEATIARNLYERISDICAR